MRLALGEYVWLAEFDDYAHERMLERLARCLRPSRRSPLLIVTQGMFPPTIG